MLSMCTKSIYDLVNWNAIKDNSNEVLDRVIKIVWQE